MGSSRRVVGHLPAYSAERRQLQFRSALVLVVVAGRGRGVSGDPAGVCAAAAAALQKGTAEGSAEAQQQHRRDSGTQEHQQLTEEMQQRHGALRDPGRHVRWNHVAHVLGNHARAVDDRQCHHGAVHLAFQSDLLLVASGAAAFCATDAPGGGHRAADGEERRQAEVAAEAPPETRSFVGQTQDVQSVGEGCGDTDQAAFGCWLVHRAVAVFWHQLTDQELGEGKEQGADPDDGQLGGGGGAVLDHLVVHLHIGRGAETVDAERTEGEGGHAERRHLEKYKHKHCLVIKKGWQKYWYFTTKLILQKNKIKKIIFKYWKKCDF